MLLEGLNTRLKKTDIVSELERATAINKYEEQRNMNSFRTIWDNIKLSSISIIQILETGEKRDRIKIFEKIIIENF